MRPESWVLDYAEAMAFCIGDTIYYCFKYILVKELGVGLCKGNDVLYT